MHSFQIDTDKMERASNSFLALVHYLEEQIATLSAQLSILNDQRVDNIMYILRQEISRLESVGEETQVLQIKGQKIASCYLEEENEILWKVRQLPETIGTQQDGTSKPDSIWSSEYMIFDSPVWNWTHAEETLLEYTPVSALLISQGLLDQEEWLDALILDEYQEEYKSGQIEDN